MRYLIVDDDSSYLSLCETLAASDPDVDVAGTTPLGANLAVLVERLRPDVILLDLAIPDIDGLTLIPVALSQGAVVVVVTQNDYGPMRQMALEAGALAMLPKAPVATLFKRIRAVIDEQNQTGER